MKTDFEKQMILQEVKRIKRLKLSLCIERAKLNERIKEIDNQIDDLDSNLKYWSQTNAE